MSFDEKVTRIMFIREHRRNLLTAYCAQDVTKKEKRHLKRELEQCRASLRKLDPEGMFP